MEAVLFGRCINKSISRVLYAVMSVFVIIPECEMHFCKYYIDGNIGKGEWCCLKFYFSASE